MSHHTLYAAFVAFLSGCVIGHALTARFRRKRKLEIEV